MEEATIDTAELGEAIVKKSQFTILKFLLTFTN
jgi:hypothetical protein